MTTPSGPPLFASSTDLANLGDTVDDARASLILGLVSTDIRESVGWPVNAYTGTVVATGGYVKTVIIPARHVTAVGPVTADGVMLVDGVGYTWAENGVVILACWACNVSVAYAAGYPDGEVPDVFRSVCLDLALLRLDNPTGERSWSLGDESHTYASTDTREAADNDHRLDRYRVGDSW